ncbi:josephin-2 isoform X1 [Choloepus didactylus]|uniref:josephin-2 isoform X1 n=1 Tax=Choloepus didactylus TaxID=27675 RepID=UPI00189ECA23|nr:josephin-2 isoform X1 [Choloepus didactylus]
MRERSLGRVFPEFAAGPTGVVVPYSLEATVDFRARRRPLGVVVRHAGPAGNCSPSRPPRQRRASRPALGAPSHRPGGCGSPWLGGAERQAGLAPDSRLNPHRSLLGTGNYDVNVIMAALQGLGLAAVWWDRRRPLSQLVLPQVLGLILNLPSPVSLGLLSLPLRRRHWVALRQVDGVYYNLDSKLRAPQALGGEDGVRAFLAAVLAQGPCEVLLVVTKEVEGKGSWLRTD